ncbi:MAG: prepilin-type N-terminal cleavage/methylation domain-containing protein [Candidatus Omnitrophica bacterium]|nr:prepilin-type N-terminal cleavage/methylation domain-containing protein [Candidatus Omnitrophota bacterium]
MQKIITNRQKSGFTLVEFIMVIAIISMISVTIGVSPSTLTPRKLENEVQKIVGDLNWARAMAISTGYHYRIDFDINNDTVVSSTDNNTYIIYKVDPADLVNGTPVKRGVLRVDGINLTHSSPAVPIYLFEFISPQGGLNSTVLDPLTIHLELSGAASNITVRNLTGYISWDRL